MKGVGIDCVDIAKLKFLTRKKDHPFLKHFTKRELEFCFKYKDPTPHLAGVFAAKEAVSKALGAHLNFLGNFEIRHNKYGAPFVLKKNKRLAVLLSITHSSKIALAIAIAL